MSAKKLFLTSLTVFSFGCASLPPKPTGDICLIDLPRSQLVCAPLGGASSVDQVFSKQFVIMNATTTIPLDQADKYISFSPDTWGNVHVYIKKLEDFAQNRCQ